MSCYRAGNLTICTPTWSKHKKVRRHCPNCCGRRTFACFFQEWYGWLDTCLNCGDSWQDGEWMPRPFAPGWRKESVADARERYRLLGRQEEK